MLSVLELQRGPAYAPKQPAFVPVQVPAHLLPDFYIWMGNALRQASMPSSSSSTSNHRKQRRKLQGIGNDDLCDLTFAEDNVN